MACQFYGLYAITGFTNNFFFNSHMVKTGPVSSGLFFSPSGAPQAFPDPSVVSSGIFTTQTPVRFPYPGEAGSRNVFRGQGYFGTDMGLSKSWSITEHQALKFAWEVFNVTNSVRWGNPNTGFSTAAGNTFGQIAGTTGGQRSIRFGGRFAF